jgi:hypothetical protein
MTDATPIEGPDAKEQAKRPRGRPARPADARPVYRVRISIDPDDPTFGQLYEELQQASSAKRRRFLVRKALVRGLSAPVAPASLHARASQAESAPAVFAPVTAPPAQAPASEALEANDARFKKLHGSMSCLDDELAPAPPYIAHLQPP